MKGANVPGTDTNVFAVRVGAAIVNVMVGGDGSITIISCGNIPSRYSDEERIALTQCLLAVAVARGEGVHS